MHNIRVSFGITAPHGEFSSQDDVRAVVPVNWLLRPTSGVGKKYTRTLILLASAEGQDDDGCITALNATASPLAELDAPTLEEYRQLGMKFELVVSSFTDGDGSVLQIGPELAAQVARLQLPAVILFETA